MELSGCEKVQSRLDQHGANQSHGQEVVEQQKPQYTRQIDLEKRWWSTSGGKAGEVGESQRAQPVAPPGSVGCSPGPQQGHAPCVNQVKGKQNPPEHWWGESIVLNTNLEGANAEHFSKLPSGHHPALTQYSHIFSVSALACFRL